MQLRKLSNWRFFSTWPTLNRQGGLIVDMYNCAEMQWARRENKEREGSLVCRAVYLEIGRPECGIHWL